MSVGGIGDEERTMGGRRADEEGETTVGVM